MLPIPSDYIGNEPGRISVRFHNGTEVVDGFIVKQTGTVRYVVSDGVEEYVVRLANTQEELDNLGPGDATILCYPFVNGEIIDTPEHIKNITMFVCFTVEGHRYGWRFDRADEKGEVDIARIG
jgi:hypothetical protein